MTNPTTARARELRRNMTAAERRLWSRLRRLREQGLHFRRQTPFEGYFLDFVCFTRRLVVEVDGGQHADDLQTAHDAVRDKILTRHGFRVIRVWNGEVWRELDVVMHRIVLAAEAQPSMHPAKFTPSPNGEGGWSEATVGWGKVGRSAESADDPHFPTLAAPPPVPPH